MSQFHSPIKRRQLSLCPGLHLSKDHSLLEGTQILLMTGKSAMDRRALLDALLLSSSSKEGPHFSIPHENISVQFWRISLPVVPPPWPETGTAAKWLFIPESYGLGSTLPMPRRESHKQLTEEASSLLPDSLLSQENACHTNTRRLFSFFSRSRRREHQTLYRTHQISSPKLEICPWISAHGSPQEARIYTLNLNSWITTEIKDLNRTQISLKF